MTKQLRVPILLDEVAANYVRRHMPASEGRCRRLACVRPYGMDTPLNVSELLPPIQAGSLISDEHIAAYESAVDNFAACRWDEALDLLSGLPGSDRARDFLMIYIASNEYRSPANWDGVISLTSK